MARVSDFRRKTDIDWLVTRTKRSRLKSTNFSGGRMSASYRHQGAGGNDLPQLNGTAATSPTPRCSSCPR